MPMTTTTPSPLPIIASLPQVRDGLASVAIPLPFRIFGRGIGSSFLAIYQLYTGCVTTPSMTYSLFYDASCVILPRRRGSIG